MCETTDKKDKLRLQDSATDNKTAKEAAAIFEKGLRAAFAACEGQELR